MGVLRFDGVDDELRWTALTSVLANVSDGAWTLAVLYKTAVWVSNDAGEGLSYLLSGGGSGVAEAGVSISDPTGTVNDQRLFIDVDAGATGVTTLTDLTDPYLVVVSKGAGTATPRLAWKLGSGGAWTHENFDATIADQIAATMLQIGMWQGGDRLNAWVGVVGWWEGAMSDANKEALDNNWRTSDWWTSAHGQPQFLAELNVVASSVIDLAGNASSPSHTGTTLDSGETLNSWNFNGKGAVDRGTILRRTYRPAPFRPGLAR